MVRQRRKASVGNGMVIREVSAVYWGGDALEFAGTLRLGMYYSSEGAGEMLDQTVSPFLLLSRCTCRTSVLTTGNGKQESAGGFESPNQVSAC